MRYFATVGVDDAKAKKKFFEMLTNRSSYIREQAVKYFATVGAEDTEVAKKIFGLLKDESYSLLSRKSIQDIAVEYLTKNARGESLEKALILFKTEDEPAKKGAYKLMKALLITQ